jgi:hypothetical protein
MYRQLARRLASILLLAGLSPVALGEIYKTVDANGNVVFTDIAPVDRSGQPAAQPVTVDPVNSYQPPPAPVPQQGDAPPESDDVGYYAEIAVISPLEDETIRDNSGNVQIQITIAPRLRGDHRLMLILDGNDIGLEAVNGVFELSNVDRGTHTAAGRVIDQLGNTVIESSPVTFNLMRVALGPENATPTPR